MSSLRGSMELLPILLILTLTDAKRRAVSSPKQGQDYKSRKSNSGLDVYPASFQGPVDFGHVYKDGFGDLQGKQISDLLDLAEPRSPDHARELLRKAGDNIEWPRKVEKPLGFANPRDAMQYSHLKLNGQRDLMVDKNIGQTSRKPVVANNGRKVASKPIQDTIKMKPTHVEREQEENFQKGLPKRKYFARDSFGLISEESQYGGNWTTCQEFAKGAVFHPDDIINIPWLPFYIWSLRDFRISVIHTFSYPTKKMVQKCKETIGPYLNIKVDWEQPKLLLKESNDMLLIAADRRGLFHGVPLVDLPSSLKSFNLTVPVIIVRLKILDPYIAMMYCNENFATIMAVAGTGPDTDAEKTAEAAILTFVGIGKPASRDLKLEALKEKYEKDRNRKEKEGIKYVEAQPMNKVDTSLW